MVFEGDREGKQGEELRDELLLHVQRMKMKK